MAPRCAQECLHHQDGHNRDQTSFAVDHRDQKTDRFEAHQELPRTLDIVSTDRDVLRSLL